MKFRIKINYLGFHLRYTQCLPQLKRDSLLPPKPDTVGQLLAVGKSLIQLWIYIDDSYNLSWQNLKRSYFHTIESSDRWDISIFILFYEYICMQAYINVIHKWVNVYMPVCKHVREQLWLCSYVLNYIWMHVMYIICMHTPWLQYEIVCIFVYKYLFVFCLYIYTEE